MTLSKEQQTENVRLIRRKEVQAKTGLGAFVNLRNDAARHIPQSCQYF